MSYHNKPALYKDGFPNKKILKKQSRVIELQSKITHRIITEGYRPYIGDEFQKDREEIDKLRKELGIR
jgi:hypothetical protein